ncbi:MAG: tetratricopeptide repeat protein [Woeseiaceae bacterium]
MAGLEQADEKLKSWKAIANYLNRDVRTAQRWERYEGLPVHRHDHRKRATVFAYPREIDAWLDDRCQSTSSLTEASLAHVNRRGIEFFILAILCAALSIFAYDKWWRSTPGTVSIAVLPFKNLSGDSDNAYFCDGVAEEILNALAGVDSLRVTARTSSFRLRESELDAVEIGKTLGVQYFLEGSVRSAGNLIRITAQLIDASTGFHLWSRTFDGNPASIFALQDRIASGVVASLSAELNLQVDTSPLGNVTDSIEAHNALMRGRVALARRTLANTTLAIGEFEKAIELDPDYAIAHAELAKALLLRSTFDHRAFPLRSVADRTASHVERALVLDPDLAEARAASGLLAQFRNDFDEALAQYGVALRENPNYAIVHTWLGHLYQDYGYYEKALSSYESAAGLDPLSGTAIYNYALSLLNHGRLAEAHQAVERLAALFPDTHAMMRRVISADPADWSAYTLAGLDALLIGPMESYNRRYLANMFAVIGLEQEALAVMGEPLASVYMYLGRPEAALELLKSRYPAHPDDDDERVVLGRTLAAVGDYERARPLLESGWNRQAGRVYGDFGIGAAANLVVARRAIASDADVSDLLAAMREDVRRKREAGFSSRFDLGGPFWTTGYEAGLTAYLAGERDTGLELILAAVKEGVFIPEGLAYYDFLYGDPGFSAIRRQIRVQRSTERAQLLEIVCSDNPYSSVWQPEKATCDEYRARIH